jgi:hypothetical protein
MLVTTRLYEAWTTHVFLISLLAATVLLAGCSHQLVLYPRDVGPVGKGVANESGKKVSITLEDTVYLGTYVHDSGSAIIGNTFGVGSVGSSVIQMSGLSTGYVPGTGNGQLFVRAQNGLSIRCEFTYRSGSGLGVCQRSDGKQYDLQILN